jgi:uncharacterized protein YbaA (DUF1428 family)
MEKIQVVSADVPDGELTSLPMAVKCEEGEDVVFSWIVWPSREVRDAGNKAAMEDSRLQDWDLSKMPFDGKRMIFGAKDVSYTLSLALESSGLETANVHHRPRLLSDNGPS